MALEQRNVVMHHQIFVTQTSFVRFYRAAVTDPAAEVETAGYFNAVADRVAVGDIIEIVAAAGTQNATLMQKKFTVVPTDGSDVVIADA